MLGVLSTLIPCLLVPVAAYIAMTLAVYRRAPWRACTLYWALVTCYWFVRVLAGL